MPARTPHRTLLRGHTATARSRGVGVAALAAALVAAGCGGSSSAAVPGDAGTTTLYVTSVPGSGLTPPSVTVPASPAEPTTTVPDGRGLAARLSITDNRLFLLGDSILGSIVPQYSDEAREQLRPLGWRVTIDAVQNRTTAEGISVLRRKRDQIGQVVVIQLGNNWDGDTDRYGREIDEIMRLLDGVPLVVFMTINEFKSKQVGVNEVLGLKSFTYPQMRIIDWNAIVRAHPEYLVSDGLHLNEEGAAALARAIGEAIGPAPGVDPATVPNSPITNPSPGGTAPATVARNAGGSAGTTTTRAAGTTTASTTTTTRAAGGSSTTVPESTTTTVKGATSTTAVTGPSTSSGTSSSTTATTVGGGGGGSTSTTAPPATTAPATTAPATTAPGTTAPGTTAPPTTSPGP